MKRNSNHHHNNNDVKKIRQSISRNDNIHNNFSIFDSRQLRNPCSLPYQSPTSQIVLDFNYWINKLAICNQLQCNNQCFIFHHDFINILLLLLNKNSINDENLSFPFQITLPFSHISLITIRGLNPIVLSESIHNDSHLSMYTSIPIRHAIATDQSRISLEKNIWKFMDVEEMISQIIWPLNASLTKNQLQDLDIIDLFTNHTVLCKVECEAWCDTITLKVDTDQSLHDSLSNLLENKKTADPNTKFDEFLPKDGDILGKFRRTQVADSGMYILRFSNPKQLILIWFKNQSIDVFNESSPENSIGSSFCFSCIEKDSFYTIDITSAIYSKVNINTNDVSTNVNVQSNTNPSLEIDINKLKQLQLTPVLFDLLGYPNNQEDKYFIDTSSLIWSSTSSLIESKSTRFQFDSRSDNMEEGEEVDEEIVEEALVESIGLSKEDELLERVDACAIDCEMCYTSDGLELTRVTVISLSSQILYDTLVKPMTPILDYNTTYSGITKELMENVTITLKDVHNKLKKIIGPETILIGHSLDSDLRVLKLIHHNVIDTCALYPHCKGLPFKISLKKLAFDLLNKLIQDNEESGHDSVQDAMITLELVLLKLQHGEEYGMPKAWEGSDLPRESIFNRISTKYDCYFHDCIPIHTTSCWERFSLGYRPESSLTSLEPTEEFKEQREIIIKQHNANDDIEITNSAIQDIKDFQSEESKDSEKRLFLWTEYHWDNSKSIQSLHANIAKIYDALPSSTLLFILSQGDLSELKILMSKKQRSRWESSQDKKPISGSHQINWTDEDEKRLIALSAYAIANCLFIRQK